jgi:hypothetical protein
MQRFPAVTQEAHMRRLVPVSLLSVCLLGVGCTGAISAAPVDDQAYDGLGTCRIEQFRLANDPSRRPASVRNCSAQPVDAVNNVLSNSDAFALGLLSDDDDYLANNEWVAWVDRTRAPGMLRGL